MFHFAPPPQFCKTNPPAILAVALLPLRVLLRDFTAALPPCAAERHIAPQSATFKRLIFAKRTHRTPLLPFPFHLLPSPPCSEPSSSSPPSPPSPSFPPRPSPTLSASTSTSPTPSPAKCRCSP